TGAAGPVARPPRAGPGPPAAAPARPYPGGPPARTGRRPPSRRIRALGTARAAWLDGRTMDVTTWYLEQTHPDDLRPARPPAQDVRIVRAEIPSPEFSRFLYTAVGGDWRWTDRLPWSWRQWKEWLDRPGTETWVAWLRGTPAGYVEL